MDFNILGGKNMNRESIQIMMEEHQYIKRMLEVIRRYCYRVLQGKEVEYTDVYRIIDFIRNYADRHHHGKEEKILFNRMMEEMGALGEKLIRQGMLVEHDLGRLYTQELEIAVGKVINGDEESKLDLIANAIGYTHLLHRHIDKEDEVIYTFAEKNLSAEILDEVDEQCKTHDIKEEKEGTQQKYISLVEELENKY